MNKDNQPEILIIGAGRSISGLLQYFSDIKEVFPVQVRLVDANEDMAILRSKDYSFIRSGKLDVENKQSLCELIATSDLVISMVPAYLHNHVAKACLQEEKNLFTASYVSEEIASLNDEAKNKGLLFLMECGLDPGIDHMSAQSEIDAIISEGGVLDSFKSYTGGLVAPESDDNPWNYKFTWNPKNVVLAGTEVVKYLKRSQYKYIPYHEVFQRLEEVRVSGLGLFEAYANRDSLKYRRIYGIDHVPTILRGTLRRPGFSRAWNVFVQLGLTDDSYKISTKGNYTVREFLNSFLAYHGHYSVEDKLCMYFDFNRQSDIYKKMEWLGLFSDDVLPTGKYSPAQLLLFVLEKKWQLSPEDKDMVVMQHQLKYTTNGEHKTLRSSMHVKGKDAAHTSMAQTVGLPLAMAARLFLEGKLDLKGVCRPTHKQLYEPILKWLNDYGVMFTNENS